MEEHHTFSNAHGCTARSPWAPGRGDKPASIAKDEHGSTIVEAAVALPLMIFLLLGAISYGIWFMAAHSVQQAANEGARAALAALDAGERAQIVDDVVENGVLSVGTIDPDHLLVETDLTQNLFTVTLTYDPSQHVLLNSSLIPMPQGPIRRVASVRLSSI